VNSKIPDRFLVADVGGTNARFAVAERSHECPSSGFRLVDPRSLAVSQFGNFDDAIAEYLDSSGLAQAGVAGASLAVASAVGIGEIRFTNSPWRFSRKSLTERFQFKKLLIVNDFEALARQIEHSPPSFINRCRDGESHPTAARIVVGPGTGLGVAGLIRHSSADGRSRWIPIPGEGGHIAFAPGDDIEEALLAYLRKSFGRVSIERVASGPGLTNIYQFLACRAGCESKDDSPDAISKRALSTADPIATDAVNLFLGIVGSFAGDAAMMFGARGGVFLGGGILPRLVPLLGKSGFFKKFDEKGRHSDWMAKIPIDLIVNDKAALLGAAIALNDES